MRQKSMAPKSGAEQVVRDIRRQTRKQYSAEEKIRIVLSGLRGEDSITEIPQRVGVGYRLAGTQPAEPKPGQAIAHLEECLLHTALAAPAS